MAQFLMQAPTTSTSSAATAGWPPASTALAAVVVTERDEPQAVIGSTLHAPGLPGLLSASTSSTAGSWSIAHEHPGKDISDQILHPCRKPEMLAVQARGEYLYAACGEGGLRVFDIAFIDDKGFSERITTAPVSPLGQQFYVPHEVLPRPWPRPTTIAPTRRARTAPRTTSSKVHALYGYLYVADKYEGLILVGAGTTLDGNPLNNFLKRELTFNPDGLLNGACAITHRRHLRLRLLRRRAGGGLPGRPEAARK